MRAVCETAEEYIADFLKSPEEHANLKREVTMLLTSAKQKIQVGLEASGAVAIFNSFCKDIEKFEKTLA